MNCNNESTMTNYSDNSSLGTNHSNNSTLEKEDCGIYCPIYLILDMLHLYYIPCIILFGLIGNVLSGLVFLNTYLKLRSSSYYLAALATADFVYLLSLFLVWLNDTHDWKVFNKNGWCEMVTYISAVSGSLSSWLIVSFTVERFIAVQYPLHRPHLCTTTRAKTIVLGLTILSLTSHSYVFITAAVERKSDASGDDLCKMKSEYTQIMHIITIIDSIASLVVPIILIVIMNVMIMINLHKFGQRFKNQEPAYTTNVLTKAKSEDINLYEYPSAHSSKSDGGEINLAALMGIPSTSRRPPSQQSYHSAKSYHSSRSHHSRSHHSSSCSPSTSTTRQHVAIQVDEAEIKKECTLIVTTSRTIAPTRLNQENITKMLVLISSVFIFLNLPSYVIRLFAFYFEKPESPSFWCLQQFVMLLYYTHFSINFILYAMCGATFRRCLKQMLRRMLSDFMQCFYR